MASDLIPISVAAPGFYGLNLQDSPTALTPEFALTASNCVIDQYGRVGARKGWTKFSAYNATIGAKEVTCIHEYVSAAGATYFLFIAGGHIWEMNTSTGALTDAYTGTWTNAGTYGGDKNWKAVTFNGYVWFFKRGEDPLRYTQGSPSTIAKVSAVAGYLGTVQQANEVLSAYGRLWTADTSTDKVTIQWSDTLIGQAWTGGASGSLNINTILTRGTRPITAMVGFNGNLVVFCDTCILLFGGADADPSTDLALIEVIDGIGCISRNSVAQVGDDVFFLSSTGLHSLGRVINEKSNPINNLGRNVRDQLIADIATNADNETIKAVYNDVEGFYLLTLISANKTYCFDLKKRLEDGSCRVTTWTLVPYCWAMDTNKNLWLGAAGYVGKYTGYYDNGSNSYLFSYTTSFISTEQRNILKIMKNLRMIVVGGATYTLRLSWGFDYQGLPRTVTKALSSLLTASEYSIAEFSDGRYGDPTMINLVKTPMSGYGQILQLNVQTSIAGQAMSIQQIDMYAKYGRLP